jgi:hypothetical protein
MLETLACRNSNYYSFITVCQSDERNIHNPNVVEGLAAKVFGQKKGQPSSG